MKASQINQTKKRHQVWIDNNVYANVMSLQLRDETWSSIVGFLYEYYNAHKDEVNK